MGQPVDNTGQSAGDGGQSATANDGTATGTTATGQSAGTEASTTTTVSQADFDALKRQLQAADQNRSRVEQELKAIKDAQLSEEDKRKKDLEEAQKLLADREQKLRDAEIRNAFLTDNTYDWKDPRAALKLADLSGVTVEGDKVSGLKEALKAVADAFPFMIKEKDSTTETSSASTTGSTGVTGQGSSATRTANTNKAELERKFPQLRGRVSG